MRIRSDSTDLTKTVLTILNSVNQAEILSNECLVCELRLFSMMAAEDT